MNTLVNIVLSLGLSAMVTTAVAPHVHAPTLQPDIYTNVAR